MDDMLSPLHDAAARWVSGWCLSRHLASRPWRDGWLVDVSHPETRFMRVALTPAPSPVGVRLEVLDGVAHARVEVDGVKAAWGQAAVVGADAVVDKIGTDPAYRRRGLASQVMAGLAAWATGQGASTGFLFASAEGVPLYTRLGWQELAPLASFQGRPST